MIFETRVLGIRIVSRSKFLIDGLGHDLRVVISMSPEHWVNRKILIVLGVHLGVRGITVESGEKVVVVNTEHLFDAEGLPLPRMATLNFLLKWQLRGRVIWSLAKSDMFLDISAFNQRYYHSYLIPSFWRSKILFGPFLFPSSPLPQLPAGERAMFFGYVSPRRALKLSSLRHQVGIDVEENLYGSRLLDKGKDSRAVVNLHAYEGTYTEWPRILTAVLWSKELWSEMLAPPLKAGLHYRLISEEGLLGDPLAPSEPNALALMACSQYPATAILSFLDSRAS